MATTRRRAAFPIILAAAAMSGCARPGHGDPTPVESSARTIVRAQAAIAEAVASGADSLAAEQLSSARRLFETAAGEEHLKHTDRSSLLARESIADAGYAKALAERTRAERLRSAAAAQLADTAASGPAGPPSGRVPATRPPGL
jgi:hypothetical protein